MAVLYCSSLFLTLMCNVAVALRAIWNVPSEKCSIKYNITVPLEEYGIESNQNQSFYGSKIVVFYRDKIGQYPYIEKRGKRLRYVNGGIPQVCFCTLPRGFAQNRNFR